MRYGGRGWWGFALACATLWLACAGLTGCQNFFVCEKASCPNSGSGGTNNSGDYAYVSNSATGPTYVSAYNVATGTLSAISGSPFLLNYVPVAMKVSPNNSFLYAGSGAGGVYLYTISSAGVLASASGNPQITIATGSISSMDISPDGAFLFVLDQTGSTLSEYTLNTTTGALTGPTSFGVPGLTSGCTLNGTPVSQSCSVSVSPVSSGSGYVAVALGTSGTVVFPYTTTGGITTTSYATIACCNSVVGSPSGDFSLAFDSSDYLYIARTVYLSSYGSLGGTPANQGNISYSSGVTPRSVTLSKNGSYLYTANKGVGTISGFTLNGSGALTELSGSPSTGPTNVAALGVDNSGSYLIAVGYNSSTGVQLFKPSSGVLGSAVAQAGTGTDTTYPALVALTH